MMDEIKREFADDIVKYYIEENFDELKSSMSDGLDIKTFSTYSVEPTNNGITIEFMLSDNYGSKMFNAEFTYFEMFAIINRTLKRIV